MIRFRSQTPAEPKTTTTNPYAKEAEAIKIYVDKAMKLGHTQVIPSQAYTYTTTTASIKFNDIKWNSVGYVRDDTANNYYWTYKTGTND